MTVSRRTFIKGLAASGAAMTVSTPVIANSVGSSNTRSRPENAPNLLIVFLMKCALTRCSLWEKIPQLHQI